jgi:hypothetical protein
MILGRSPSVIILGRLLPTETCGVAERRRRPGARGPVWWIAGGGPSRRNRPFRRPGPYAVKLLFNRLPHHSGRVIL